MSDVKTIQIPEEMYAKIEEYIAGTDFDSVDTYLEFVVDTLLYHIENNNTEREDMDPDDGIEERLKSLGYLE